jgi:uncharacterized protein (DUF736 family)
MKPAEIPKIPHAVAEAGFDDLNPNRKKYRKKVAVYAVVIGQDIEIETREGWLRASKGDYLVANISDPSYPWPVKKSIFESTYEEVKAT